MSSFRHENTHEPPDPFEPGAGPPRAVGVPPPRPAPPAPEVRGDAAAAQSSLFSHYAADEQRYTARAHHVRVGEHGSELEVAGVDAGLTEGKLTAGAEVLQADEHHARRVARSGRIGYGEDGLSAGARYEHTTKNPDGSARVNGLSLAAGKEGLSAVAEHGRVERRADGAEVDQRRSLSAGRDAEGNLDLSLGTSREVAREGKADLRAGIGTEHGVSGLKLAGGVSDRDPGGSRDERGSLVIAADKVAVGRRSAETRNAADGTAVTEESARGVTVGDGSFAYAGSHTRKNVGADGKDGAQSQSHTVIGLGKEGVTGSHGMTHKNADGETTGAFSVAGGVNLKDGVAANGQIAAQAGPISVSMGGGITITADAPVEKAGAWHVAYRKSVNVGGALGAEAGGVGASANLSRTVVDGGVRVFATRDEALAFRKDVAAQVGAETDVTRAEAVRAIPVGETRSHAVLEAGGAGVKGKASVVDLGAHVQAQDSKTIEVKRLSKDLVEVSITRGDGLGGGGSAGAGPAKLEVGAHQKTSHRMTFTYDLSTADGRDDYETLLRTGIPILRTASFVDSQHESERGVRGGASLGPVASGEGASVTRDSEKRDAGDNRVQTYEGERRDTSGLLGSSTVDRTVLSGVEVNDKERSFTVTREIESNRGAAVADRLGETYGVSGDGANLRRKASGKWQVGTAISDPQMQGFIARAEAGALSGLGGGDLNVTARRAVLVKELAAAGSSDEKMKALARYTADLGPQAIADMEAIIDWGVDEKGAKKGPQRDLTLEGDKVWNGARFRTETEARAQKLQQALAAPGADRGNVAAQAADALGELRERRLLLRDQTRYADLPDELRAAEIDRTEAFIRRFEDLRAAATGPVGAPALGADGIAGQVVAADARIAGLRAELERREAMARKASWVHAGAHAIVSAREDWDGKEDRTAYEIAEWQMANLKTSLLGMSTWERLVDAARIGFHAAGADAAQASVRGQHLLNQLEAQEAMVKQAIATATRIRDLYAEIEARHGGLARANKLGGYQNEMPRGMK